MTLRQILAIQILMPWNNLGTLGIRVHENLYLDFYVEPHIGMFIHTRTQKRWFRLRTWAWRIRSE